jgi:archaellum component FlaC
MRSLWFTNSSGLTLDGGSFNVLESNTFAGEGLMDPIKPDEKRLLSYAIDLGVVVEDKRGSQQQTVSRVRLVHGTLMQITEVREERAYKVRNEDSSRREMLIEHPARSGVKFAADSAQPVESTVSFHRFKLTVEPKSTATLTVKEVEPKTVRYEITNLTSKQIAYFVQEKTIDENIEKALRGILAQKDGIAALDAQIESHEKEIKSVFEDQERVRENLKALKGSAEEKELTQRYTRQLNQQEDRVQALRNEVAELHRQRDAAQAGLDKTIEGLSMEATL